MKRKKKQKQKIENLKWIRSVLNRRGVWDEWEEERKKRREWRVKKRIEREREPRRRRRKRWWMQSTNLLSKRKACKETAGTCQEGRSVGLKSKEPEVEKSRWKLAMDTKRSNKLRLKLNKEIDVWWRIFQKSKAKVAVLSVNECGLSNDFRLAVCRSNCLDLQSNWFAFVLFLFAKKWMREVVWLCCAMAKRKKSSVNCFKLLFGLSN